MSKKTKKQIDNLKAQWEADPCWDIEDTEGFEDHRNDLVKYRKETENRWDYERIMRIEAQAFRLDCKFKTAKYTLALEDRIAALEAKLNELSDRVVAYQVRSN
jgi:hypothetical protein